MLIKVKSIALKVKVNKRMRNSIHPINLTSFVNESAIYIGHGNIG